MKDDVFKGKEIDALLRAAAHLQEEEKSNAGDEVGLTLKEVEEIAAESGIDPKFVRQAAIISAVEPDDDDKFHFWGGPTSIRRNFVVNRALSKQEMERLVRVFQRVKDSAGRTDSLDESLTWSSTNQRNQAGMTVTMQAEDDATLCTLKSPVMMPGFLVHYIPFILTFMVSLPLVAKQEFSAIAVATALAALSALFLVTRIAYGKLADKKKEQLLEIEAAIKAVGRGSTSEGEIATIGARSPETQTENLGQSDASAPAPDRLPLEDDVYTGPNDGKAQQQRDRFRE